ncbi:MAG: taurine catabolism dioxygenase TauD, partial [Rhodospirillaceae bacterium]|nr:taurine catabolism dioxygenase TauD [Rhodospirillaceae bacterium]
MPRAITEACNWLGPGIASSGRWIYQLSRADIAEIDAALEFGKARGMGLADLTKENFPLPAFQARIDTMLDEIETGLGIYLLRGFPALNYGKGDLRHICWGIGLYCGQAVSQSKRGDLLGDVRDIGTPADGPTFRGYTSS